MKQYKLQTGSTFSLSCLLIAGMLAAVSCRKEKTLEPSNLDQNYFVVSDNPDDPADHAIYEFYKSTGIAAFYKDSIYKKKVSRDGEVPERYTYIKLSLEYTPLGNYYANIFPLTSKKDIPALMKLLQEEVIPKIPSPRMIPSILLADSFTNYVFMDMKIAGGWSSLYGFNTVGIKVEDMEAMTSDDKKMYAASILAGIADKKISELNAAALQKDFFSISRNATSHLPIDIYYGLPFMLLMPPGTEPAPASIGFLYYPSFDFQGMPLPSMPRETEDARAFLAAAFRYSATEFTSLHPNEPLILKKFGIIRELAKEAGFKLPE